MQSDGKFIIQGIGGLKRGNERLNSFIPDGSRVGRGYVVSVVEATLLLLETTDL
jgi:hypothetical protein